MAIKKITNAFEDAVDCKRILREIRLLQHFSHENVLNLRDIMMPPPGKAEDWKDIYLVTELLDTDLHYIIHSKQALSDDHIQYFVYQILRDLKICDFGLALLVNKMRPRSAAARGVDSGSAGAHRVRRDALVPRAGAPRRERDVRTAIDIWSVGCILAEFLGRKAIFPGRDYLQQLRLIVECLGAPSASDLSMINNPQAVEYIKALPKRPAVSFAKLYPNANAAGSILEKMLVFDPRNADLAADALKHEYAHRAHNVNDEPDAAPFDFAFEKEGEETALRAEILGRMLKSSTPAKVDEEMEKRFAAAPTAS